MKLHPSTLRLSVLMPALMCSTVLHAQNLNDAIAADYNKNLKGLFEHLHQNPELSFMEFNTSKRLAEELTALGYEVTPGVGKTGVVAILKNGKGPMVMMRADMDALPVEEKSGLPYASKTKSKDWFGKEVSVMHACGHDMHVTSLVGTARQMVRLKDQWSGTLMLIGQPAEEYTGGAIGMRNDKIYQRFGTPDYAMALHVSSEIEAGKIVAVEGSPFSGVDSVDIEIPGVGAHGASPHRGKDPIVLGAQIVMALQTIVSREIAPKEPSVITVGSFHAGSKHNIIPDSAHLQLTVRSDTVETRDQLIAAIERVAVNMGRVAGMPEDKLPKVTVDPQPMPPTINDIPLTQRLKTSWTQHFGADIFDQKFKRLGMGAEDYPFLIQNPTIPSVYFQIGGTPKAAFEAERNGGAAVPSHHSPLFKISPEPAIRSGVEATVVAMLELMPKT